MPEFTEHQKKIIRILHEYSRWMTISEIIDKGKTSWKVASQALGGLYDMEVVTYKEKGNKRFWKLKH